MRRLVWFGLGAVTGGWIVFRGREKAREVAELASPRNLGRNLGRSIGARKVEVSQNLAEFFSSVSDGARQREDELRAGMLQPADHPSTRP